MADPFELNLRRPWRRVRARLRSARVDLAPLRPSPLSGAAPTLVLTWPEPAPDAAAAPAWQTVAAPPCVPTSVLPPSPGDPHGR